MVADYGFVYILICLTCLSFCYCGYGLKKKNRKLVLVANRVCEKVW